MLNTFLHSVDYVGLVIFAPDNGGATSVPLQFNFFNLILFIMFDFSKTKVREDGKVLDKFSLCRAIHRVSISLGKGYFSYLTYSIYPELYTYRECKETLKMLLSD